MAADWRDLTLGEFIRLQRGHDLTETDRRPGLVPIMGSAGHNGFHDTAKATGPGVVIGRSGVGSMGFVTYCATDYWPHNTVLYVTDFLGNNERFSYYFLKHLNLRQFDSGSAQASLNRNYIYPIRIHVPHEAEQRAIAHILGTLDDKIELNRRMNETLETMARELFRSWFVTFDPVRAKAEGRDPGLPKHLADLFPDSFEESELGEIPKGWSAGHVEDEFDLTMGQSPPGETYNERGEGLPFYQGCADFGIRFPRRRVYCTAPSRIANAGDTLISVRAPVGELNMATECCAIGRGVAAARHKSGSRSYSYQFMNSIGNVFERFEGEGTVFGSIGKKDFNAISCVIPLSHLVLAFERFLSPVDDRVEIHERESHILTNLRDTLLPKLISGELRVKDAERFLDDRGI